jgi:uncharacterized protein (UPF0248 family)
VTILVGGICRAISPTASAAEVVVAAITRYVDFPWEKEIFVFPGLESRPSGREDRDVMYVSSIHRPMYNVTRNASKSTLATIQREFRSAKEKVLTMTFDEICQDGVAAFLQDYKSFIKIHCVYWGQQSVEGRKWVTWIESRLVVLLVNLSREFPSLETRLWPGRFGDLSSEDVQGVYLIGVSGTGVDEGTFRTVLRDVETMMKKEEEATDRWVSVTLSKGKEIISENLEIDSRIWDGEEDIVLDDEMEDEDEESSPAPPGTVSDVRSGKLRPSRDVYNRLFWDKTYSVDDFLLGYEDRFKGVREMPLVSWKRELTDEEYIPFHRVVYFREKGVDGKVIWDRRTRLDLIFGSG